MWNAKLLCTKIYSALNERNFAVGQIYKVCEGRFIDGNGNKSYDTYENIKEIKESFYADFEEMKC